MPESSFCNGERSRGHCHLDGVGARAGIILDGAQRIVCKIRRLHRAVDALLAPQMAAWDDLGGAVDFGRVIDRPKGTHAESGPGTRCLNRAVIVVPGLDAFAGM